MSNDKPKDSKLVVDELDIEWMILCDAAQISNGKLYLLGGGWDRLFVNNVPVKRKMAIATAVRVPWGSTNERHSLEFRVLTEDGNELANVKGEFETGRPAGLPPGTSQRAQIVLDLNLEVVSLGQYVIDGILDSIGKRQVVFTVVPGPRYQLKPPQSQRP